MGNKASGEKTPTGGGDAAAGVGKPPVKVCFFGTGGSGKTTFIKQCRVLYDNFLKDPNDTTAFAMKIQESCLDSMTQLVNQMERMELEVEGDAEDAAEACKLGFLTDFEELVPLFKDDAIQETFGRRHEFPHESNMIHYLPKLEEIVKDDYAPSVEDVIFLHDESQTMTEVKVTVGDQPVTFVDVGGFREMRKHWAPLYELTDIGAACFFVSLNEYPYKLKEDNTTMSLKESLSVFGSVLGVEKMKGVPMMLIFNKLDLFEQNLKTINFDQCGIDGCPSGADGQDPAKCKEFIEKQFQALNTGGQTIHVFYLSAANKDEVGKCLSDCLSKAGNG